MTGSEVIAGVAAIAIGAVALTFSIIYSRNEEWRIRAAGRKHLEHRLSPGIREGQMTVDEWNQRYADQQKRLTRLVAIPVAVFFILFGLVFLVQGLVSS
jgi:hypothetical protein